MRRQDFYTVASNPVMVPEAGTNVLFGGESQTKPAHRLGPKVYDFYLMHVVLSGKGVFECGGKRHELQTGDTFLIEPEQLVSYESDQADPWRYRWVAFTGPEAPGLVAAAGLSTAQPVADNAANRRIPVLYNLIFNSFRLGGSSAPLKAAGYLHLLAAEYREAAQQAAGNSGLEAADGSERLLQQVIHYLSTQYAHPVSIEQMSESLGYNRAYLSRLFKRHTGVSPVTFLLKLRIDKARQMLRERDELTIEQIAASVGLQDSLYFSKQFRRFYGQSPTSYREAMRSLNKPQ
ncbi:AraC family transcriptional regulator [Paenibacillus radicis (ex Gao et al. 2016)]|uniref:AraC family transcriptional regulator n=1 Tax=Paenibacillus radicis (ex Gao et al. 2016) TaxID=1737354 RepID=A0A917M7J6_9BACL|nr:AraC family transcriptional regulator [Paenibacillus radicis (ex Gao et al. 2016)]GGG82481.1 AraC family transcriptional regulator [Paenibacillus radicis (ex Gao et al. 2016)]